MSEANQNDAVMTEIKLDPKLISGKYKLKSSEKWDEYLIKMGVGYIQRKLMSASGSVMTEIQFDGTSYSTKIVVLGITVNEIKFNLNEVFDGSLVNGRTYKSKCVLEGNKFLQTFERDDMKCEVVRDYSVPGLMTTILTSDDLTATQVYEKLP